MRRARLAAVLLGFGVAACAEPIAPFDGVFDFELRFEVGDVVRSALVHVPASYDGGARAPLVLVFHGGGGTAEEIRDFSGFDAVADALGLVIAYPRGAPGWLVDGEADRAFVRETIARLDRRIGVDPARVYATGFSRGGVWSMHLACGMAGRFAAVAAVAATLDAEDAVRCAPSRRISALLLVGSVDLVVPIDGDAATGRLSARATIEVFARRNGCGGEPETGTEPDTVADGRTVRWERFPDCRDGTETVLYVVQGAGHTWPAGDIDPARLIGEFLLRHSR